MSLKTALGCISIITEDEGHKIARCALKNSRAKVEAIFSITASNGKEDV